MGAMLNIPIRGQKISLQVEVREVQARIETRYQTIEIVDTEALGQVLLLDGHVQLSTLDEKAYHEALVHIPLLSLDGAKSALVVGGGDGGVLRELCKHPLERIHMVEIDEAVVNTCMRHLLSVSAGAFADPRVTLHIADAFAFMKEVREPYDLVVLDITDVYEGEDGALSEQLFTPEFYADCARALAPGGMLVTQADNHVFCPYSMEGIFAALRPHFRKLGSYQALVPSFGGFSAYVWASEEGEISSGMPISELEFVYLSPTTWALALEGLPFATLRA
jgi:spermidine synthase